MTEHVNEQIAAPQPDPHSAACQQFDTRASSTSAATQQAIDDHANDEPSSHRSDLDDSEQTKHYTSDPEVGVQVAALQQQLEDEHRKLLTTLADMANLRKRTGKESFNARNYALEGFIKDVLETVDNLERSLANTEQQPATLKEFYTGIELTLKSLKEVLVRYDVKEINPINQPFDHQLHTAISTQATPPDQKVAANTVISVVQKGYQLKDRLLRPAMVIVAQ